MAGNDTFYANTYIRDFYLDLWQEPGMAFSDSDEKQTIPTKYNKRPDLMANEIYGSPNYWWIFALRNKDLLIDPVEDFISGLEIRIPSNRVNFISES
jgi:hypothetical protein